MVEKVKALALLSGGLDSTIAVKLLLNQGVKVEAITFVTPFSTAGKEAENAAQVAEKLKVPLKTVNLGVDYLNVVRRPKYGYGKNMNPCIDCRIFMLKKAREYAEETGASFIVTGEVLGERPMSQRRKALAIIEEEAGLKGRVLRPLSAKLLPITEPEIRGWVDRNRLLDIKGRSRKRQIALAEEFGLVNYPNPAGGCLLTYKEYAAKLRDLFTHNKKVSLRDVHLLKIGRHFRYGENKIIVGRNEAENKALLQLKTKSDYLFEVQGCGSPITLLQGPKSNEAVKKAAELTAYYSDWKIGEAPVKYGGRCLEKSIMVSVPSREEVELLRIK